MSIYYARAVNHGVSFPGLRTKTGYLEIENRQVSGRVPPRSGNRRVYLPQLHTKSGHLEVFRTGGYVIVYP